MANEPNQIAIAFDSRVFSATAIKKAAYRYLDSFVCDISAHDKEWRCLLSFPAPTSQEACAHFVAEFKKEVLDQDLREKLKAETEPVRNLILAHTFSKTGIPNGE